MSDAPLLYNKMLTKCLSCFPGRGLVERRSADLRAADRRLPLHSGGREEHPAGDQQVGSAALVQRLPT